MIREYAVDPDAYTRNIDALQRFFTDFRAEKGRVVTAIPNLQRNWVRAQQNCIRAMQLPPVQRKKCFDKISELAASIINARYTNTNKSKLMDRTGKTCER